MIYEMLGWIAFGCLFLYSAAKTSVKAAGHRNHVRRKQAQESLIQEEIQ